MEVEEYRRKGEDVYRNRGVDEKMSSSVVE